MCLSVYLLTVSNVFNEDLTLKKYLVEARYS